MLLLQLKKKINEKINALQALLQIKWRFVYRVNASLSELFIFGHLLLLALSHESRHLLCLPNLENCNHDRKADHILELVTVFLPGKNY